MKYFFSFNFYLVCFAMATLVQRCIIEDMHNNRQVYEPLPYPDMNEYLTNAKDFLPLLEKGKIVPILRTIEDTDFAVSYVELQAQLASEILKNNPSPPDSLITAQYNPERGFIDYHFYFPDPKDKSVSVAEINVLVTYNYRSKGNISMFGAIIQRIPIEKPENKLHGVKSIAPI